MFTLTPSEKFKSTVKTQTKLENGGWREESFVAIFLRPTFEERQALIDNNVKNVPLLREWMVGWEMEDQSRQPVPFTPENFEAFLSLTGPVRDTAATFMSDSAGVKTKN